MAQNWNSWLTNGILIKDKSWDIDAILWSGLPGSSVPTSPRHDLRLDADEAKEKARISRQCDGFGSTVQILQA